MHLRVDVTEVATGYTLDIHEWDEHNLTPRTAIRRTKRSLANNNSINTNTKVRLVIHSYDTRKTLHVKALYDKEWIVTKPYKN